ncbi:hypothetical protein MMMB2_0483 [Mycobacterium marinum MB2]|nr:hypothetical protein MMMB2_0483 [Mycobacterium marinum MB2]
MPAAERVAPVMPGIGYRPREPQARIIEGLSPCPVLVRSP